MDMNTEELDSGAIRIGLNGRLDTVGVDQIELRFEAAVASSGRDVLVDLSQVSFVSSMGVRLLISAARAQRVRGSRRLVLFGAQPTVATTLDMVALDKIIPIVADEQQALAHIAQHA
jgi:anti-anti-sigma factor